MAQAAADRGQSIVLSRKEMVQVVAGMYVCSGNLKEHCRKKERSVLGCDITEKSQLSESERECIECVYRESLSYGDKRVNSNDRE